MDTILRFIYKRFAAKFNDFLVEDYLAQIPPKVKQDAFGVIQTHKRKLQRMNNFMASQLHQRMRYDHQNSEKYQGMLIQLKLIDSMIKDRPDPEHEVKDKPVQAKERFNYSDAIQTASTFAEKIKDKDNE